MSLSRELKTELFAGDPDKDTFDVYHELAKRFSHAFDVEVIPSGNLDPVPDLLRDTTPQGERIVHLAFSTMTDATTNDARSRVAYSVASQSHILDAQEGVEDRLAELNRLRLAVEQAHK